MGYKVEVVVPVKSELTEALCYIAERYASPKAMQSFVDEFDSAIAMLEQCPLLFSVDHELSRTFEREIRSVRVKKYRLFYTVDSETKTVTVISFLHTRRDATGQLGDNLLD